MRSTLRRLGVTAAAVAGIAMGTMGAAPAAASADWPCYIHGGSEPFGTCVVNSVLEMLPPLW